MAWTFDGQNDCALLGPLSKLPAAGWALGGWIRLLSNAGTSTQYLLSWGPVGSADCVAWYVYEASHAAGNVLEFYGRDHAGAVCAGATATLRPGASREWQHILLVSDGASVKQYVSGVHDGTSNTALTDIIRPVPVWFGARNVDQSRFSHAEMAEWAKWDRALSAGEIAALAAGVTPERLPAGLAMYAPMRDKGELLTRVTVLLFGPHVIDHPRRFCDRSSTWATRAQGVAP